jgi:hypothetical protein
MYTNATPSGPRITSGDWRKREKRIKELGILPDKPDHLMMR